jgi:hypothetical protein
MQPSKNTEHRVKRRQQKFIMTTLGCQYRKTTEAGQRKRAIIMQVWTTLGKLAAI